MMPIIWFLGKAKLLKFYYIYAIALALLQLLHYFLHNLNCS